MTNPQDPMPEYGTEAYDRWYRARFGPVALTPPPAKKRHPIRWTLAGIVGIVGVIVVVSIVTNVGGSKKHAGANVGAPSATATQHSDIAKPATKPTTTAPSSEYDRYVALSNAAGYTEPGSQAQAKELAGETCGMSQTDMRTLLGGLDSDHRDIAGFIVRSYCPDTYPRLKAARAALNAPKPAHTATPKPDLTVSEQQAVQSAESYLAMGGFSRAGLIQQLDSSAGEGFSVADATFAVDHVTVDWNQQALESAKSYLAMGGFSRAGLIDQLTASAGEGFTLAQATYAVDHVGL